MKPIYIPTFLTPVSISLIEEELLALQWETKRTARHEYFMSDGKKCTNTECSYGLLTTLNDDTGLPAECTVCDENGRMPVEYSYGQYGADITYTSKPWSHYANGLRHNLIQELAHVPEARMPDGKPCFFNGCFLNMYDDEKQFLGWHADDFAGMDPQAPIVVMSFGAEREIWVKRQFQTCPDCEGDCVIQKADKGGEFVDESCIRCHEQGVVPVTGIVPTKDRYLLQRGSVFIMPAGFQEAMFHRIPKHPAPCGWRISLTFRKFL